MARDVAGQNARANAKARALGYRSKDDLYRRRKVGNPTADDIKTGGAIWRTLPGGRLWIRLMLGDEELRSKAEIALADILLVLPDTARVAATVHIASGEYYRLSRGDGVPISELDNGLAYYLAEQLVSHGSDTTVQPANDGNAGVGAPKRKRTPDIPADAGGGNEDYDLYDSIQYADLVFTP